MDDRQRIAVDLVADKPTGSVSSEAEAEGLGPRDGERGQGHKGRGAHEKGEEVMR